MVFFILMQLPCNHYNCPDRAATFYSTALKNNASRTTKALLCHLGNLGQMKHTYFLYKKHFCAYILHYNCPNYPNTTFIDFLINQSTFFRAVARFTTALI